MSHTWKHREEQRFDKKHPQIGKRIKTGKKGNRYLELGGESQSYASDELEEQLQESEKPLKKKKKTVLEELEEKLINMFF